MGVVDYTGELPIILWIELTQNLGTVRVVSVKSIKNQTTVKKQKLDIYEGHKFMYTKFCIAAYSEEQL